MKNSGWKVCRLVAFLFLVLSIQSHAFPGIIEDFLIGPVIETGKQLEQTLQGHLSDPSALDSTAGSLSEKDREIVNRIYRLRAARVQMIRTLNSDLRKRLARAQKSEESPEVVFDRLRGDVKTLVELYQQISALELEATLSNPGVRVLVEDEVYELSKPLLEAFLDLLVRVAQGDAGSDGAAQGPQTSSVISVIIADLYRGSRVTRAFRRLYQHRCAVELVRATRLGPDTN